MDKINMNDKFFHGVGWDDPSAQRRYEALESILKSGYILSPIRQGMDSDHGNKIFLSVYPNGDYSSLYCGEERVRNFFEYDGFDMSKGGFYFILDSKLKDDYKITPGNYPNECTIESEIDLFKYLVGIGNAGCDFRYDMQAGYYLSKYINEEIGESELKEQFKLIFPEHDFNRALWDYILWGGLHRDFKHFKQVYIDTPSKLDEPTFKRYYFHIKDIFNENKRDINIYDNNGNFVDGEKRLLKFREMKKYLSECNYSCEKYGEKIKELTK